MTRGGGLRFVIFAFAMLVCLAVEAQSVPDTTKAENIEVSIVTIYPGSEVYELYGHTDLRINHQGKFDAFFNYGVFDFNEPGFIVKFILGETDYMCMAWPGNAVLESSGDRKIVNQKLHLTPEQAAKLEKALLNNIQPENRTYRYRYFSDNCATRPVEMLEHAIGQKISLGSLGKQWSNVTFRQAMAHYAEYYPWQQFGIDLLLGAACDTIVTQKQLLFAPMLLRKALENSTVKDNGKSVPFMEKESTMRNGDENGSLRPPTPWPMTPMAQTAILAILALLITIKQWKPNDKAKVRIKPSTLASIIDTVIFGTMAIIGCIVCFIAVFSTHEAVWPNYNVLWLHPLLLLLVVGAWRDSSRFFRICHAVNIAALLTISTIWLAHLQMPNPAFLPLAAASSMRSAAYLWLRRR